jgi:acyl carrier protein
MSESNTVAEGTESTLLGLLRAQSREPITVDATTDFVSSLGLESIQVMSFVMEVEEHFDIAIDLDSLSGVRTLRDLGALVDRAVARKGA